MRLKAAFILALTLVLNPEYFRTDALGADKTPTVTDFRGKQISLSLPAKRVVCLIESSLSGIYMLGAEKAVVAISTNVYQESVNRYYAEMDERIAQKKLPSPGNWDYVNLESVVALCPDIVIIWADQKETIDALSEKGIAVYAVALASFTDIYKEISDFGVIFEKRTRAEDLIAYAERELQELAAHLEQAQKTSAKPGVYFMWAQGELETSGAPSTVNDLIELAGARNVCDHIRKEHTIVNLENLLAWNPDVIVMWHNPKRSPTDISSLAVWEKLSASIHHKIFELPSVFFCDLWTLKYLHAVKRIAVWCHPDKFIGMDLEREKRTMLEMLYGVEKGRRIPLVE